MRKFERDFKTERTKKTSEILLICFLRLMARHLHGLFNARDITGENKAVHTFPEGIIPKVNVIALLGF